MRRSTTVLTLVGFLVILLNCQADANPVQGRSLPEEIPSVFSVDRGVTDGADRKLYKRNLAIAFGLLGHSGGGYEGSYYESYPEYYSAPEYYYPAYPAPYNVYSGSDYPC